MSPVKVQPSQIWNDGTGDAEVRGVVPVRGKGRWAVLQRYNGPGKAGKPFLFSCASMERGDDGWHYVGEVPNG